MKKILSYLIITFVICLNALAENPTDFKCEEDNSTNTTCKITLISSTSFVRVSTYKGPTKDGNPTLNHKGDRTLINIWYDKTQTKVLTQNDFTDNDIATIKAEWGDNRLFPNSLATIQVFDEKGNGYAKFLNGDKIYLKNNESIRWEDNKNSYFEGKFNKDNTFKEGTYHVEDWGTFKGTYKKNQVYNGKANHSDGRISVWINGKGTYKNPKEDKTNLYLTIYLSIIALVIFYTLFRYFKKNVKTSDIIKRIKYDLYNFGFRSKGDYYAMTLVVIILGPGALIILSWILTKLGSETLSNLIDTIFNPTGELNLIVFLYLMISTLAVFLIIVVQILEIFNKTRK